MQKYRTFLFLLFFILISVCAFCYLGSAETENTCLSSETLNCVDPVIKYGFNTSDYFIQESKILPNDLLAGILLQHDVAYSKITSLVNKTKDVFDVRNLREGKTYAIIREDSCSAADFFIYTPNAYRYICFDLRDSVRADIIEKDIDIQVESAGGVINNSLWVSMDSLNLPFDLIVKMEDALAWSVDFHHILKGDEFKLVFEREYIDGELVGVGRLLAAYFKNYNNEYYSFYYKSPKHEGYFDEKGRTSKKAFLKAPVKYSRISSSYNLRRYHPILKRVRPHKGTDYAAPYGTPILAVANGLVTKASYTKGNGKYVKIKHDDIYQTQYLHMQRFAKNIASGVHVKQGQTIGYVGSTGLATGPHVCYRFWKNGKQVNHMREKLPPPEPMPAASLPDFFEWRDSIQPLLDLVPLRPDIHESIDSIGLLDS